MFLSRFENRGVSDISDPHSTVQLTPRSLAKTEQLRRDIQVKCHGPSCTCESATLVAPPPSPVRSCVFLQESSHCHLLCNHLRTASCRHPPDSEIAEERIPAATGHRATPAVIVRIYSAHIQWSQVTGYIPISCKLNTVFAWMPLK